MRGEKRSIWPIPGLLALPFSGRSAKSGGGKSNASSNTIGGGFSNRVKPVSGISGVH